MRNTCSELMTVQFPEVSNSNVCRGHKSVTKDSGLMKQVATVFYFLPHLCKADNAHYIIENISNTF